MDSIYTIRDSPGEGLGCFATTCISPGTLILTEAPLFAVREPRTNSAVTLAFAGLDPVQQATYLTLYAQNTTAEGDARVIDIFNSNAWQTGSCTSICPLAARFNHSCVPNASFAWNSRTLQITVHAIVAIPAGMQINLSYERPYQTMKSRQEKLAAYGFTCSCKACSSDVDASDVRRSRMVVLDARIRTGRRQLWRSPVPKAALELAKLLKEEGLVGEALGLAYHEAAMGWQKYGRLDLAIATAVKELETAVICFGGDSPAVDASTAFLLELKSQYAEQRRPPSVVDTQLLEALDGTLVNDLAP
ncbi:SET domain-containing 5 [Pyrenophora seminiperda CCB06]|uniref:SET domain-containing 5 n=1 Tax=Pyrenophora seminiperda CCB06 TaxID=1302712 RepID=A0A3M7MAA7_9PLEO|nr:SET domain-containing 5 [Pyrenophora seminiperda CCB06]